MSHDGADLAAALQTIRQIGDSDALDQAIDDAFPGGRIAVSFDDGWFEVEMQQHGWLRPLKAAELSDGTVRYLLWVAALLTPRPPGLLVLNVMAMADAMSGTTWCARGIAQRRAWLRTLGEIILSRQSLRRTAARAPFS